MIIKNADLKIVYGPSSRIEPTGVPEFAFAGKSNVGKSSLINCLLNRKSLARTSAQPGKTQTINFYEVNEAFYFVDLPGYGYTAAAVNVRQSWGRMIERYFRITKTLKVIFLLTDIRHEPNANDVQMHQWVLSQGMRPVVIATKLDKIKRSQVKKQTEMIRSAYGMEKEDVLIPFSAQTRAGREQVLDLLDQALAGDG